jgi:hypothetical protein
MVGFMSGVALFMAMISRSLASHRGRATRDPSDMSRDLFARRNLTGGAVLPRGRNGHSESEFI